MFAATLRLFWSQFDDFKNFRWSRIRKNLSWPDGRSAENPLLAEASLRLGH
jgi:hypothetical protein